MLTPSASSDTMAESFFDSYFGCRTIQYSISEEKTTLCPSKPLYELAMLDVSGIAYNSAAADVEMHCSLVCSLVTEYPSTPTTDTVGDFADILIALATASYESLRSSLLPYHPAWAFFIVVLGSPFDTTPALSR